MAERTYNELLLDALVRHQIGLLRLSSGIRTRVWELLDATEADVRSQIRNRLRRSLPGEVSPANLRRMERLLESLRETRLSAWSDVRKLWIEELRALSVAEPSFMAGAIRIIFPVEIGLAIPEASTLHALVSSTAFQGRTIRGWADDVAQADLARMEQQVRIGLVQGESPAALSRRVVGTVSLRGANGVTAISRRQAETITRTAVSAISSSASREFALLNREIAPRELFVATLDSRTTPICRSLDGKTFPIDEGPVLPLHWNERSRRVPIVDGEVIGDRPIRPFTQRQFLREFAKREGFPAPTTRDGLPRGTKGAFDEFSRSRIRELTGTVPARTSYAEFLGNQSAAFQDDILGPTRGRLFRSGGVTLDRFVDETGRELSLAELARFDAEAFRAAGLDPGDFL